MLNVHNHGLMHAARAQRLRIPSDKEWTETRVAGLPPRWQNFLIGKWHKSKCKSYFAANVELRQSTEVLAVGRIPLDASDDDICEFANMSAKHCADLSRVMHETVALRRAMQDYCERQRIAPPPHKVRNGPAMSRMTCPLWWRRKLRRRHYRELESAAIRLGLISMRHDLYVSQECFEARQQQNHRNQSMLDATLATNENGQTYTLAELASFSTSKKSNRRAELMTRLRGFDCIAQELKHAGLFISLTCPSRFHRYKTLKDGKLVLENPKYDPNATPFAGQKYLANLWQLLRAKFHRDGIQIYGFRVAEPQHDGTPHWHLLLFCSPADVSNVKKEFYKYALFDSGEEPGAQEHRCVIKEIDWKKGSAVGYISKYIAKNIDGEHVGEDFHGRAAKDSAERVQEWAAVWSIRQFQQIGGPPVGVWRELRRIHDIPTDAPARLKLAHDAANKRSVDVQTGQLRVAWDKYCEAQGGVFSGRNVPIKLEMRKVQGLGRYGEELSYRPSGVRINDGRVWVIDSKRRTWTISRAKKLDDGSSRVVHLNWTQSSSTWTRVNNCTCHTDMTCTHSSGSALVKMLATPISSIQARYPETPSKDMGGAKSESTCQSPGTGADVQKAAPRAETEGKTFQDGWSDLGGLAPPPRR